MPAKKAVILSTNDIDIAFSINDGANVVVMEVSKGDRTLFLQQIPANDFKDFQRMLGDLKPLMTRPVFAPSPSNEPRENPFDHYIKDYKVTCKGE